MGRGRYNSRDQWRQHDEDGYEEYLPRGYRGESRAEERYDDDGDEVRRTRETRRRAHELPYPPAPRGRRTRETHTQPPREIAPLRPVRSQRKRSVWPALLGGCALGIFLVVLAAALVVVFAIRNLQGGSGISNLPIINLQSFSKDETQELQLNQVSQILICDQVGNVNLYVDPKVTRPQLMSKKIVRAANQASANDELKKLVVESQPPTAITHPLACAKSQGTPAAAAGTPSSVPSPATTTDSTAGTLLINVVFPNNDTQNHAVDLNIALPPSLIAGESSPSLPVDVEAPRGDINVDGLSGVLNVRGGTGNVTVKHAVLADGSHIETAQGNVTFDGFLAVPVDKPGQEARYILQSEHNVDVTLPTNTNVTLDANTNVGKISSDFPITPSNENGAMSYHGPLNAASTTKPHATLVVDVSTGNVTIHRSQQ